MNVSSLNCFYIINRKICAYLWSSICYKGFVWKQNVEKFWAYMNAGCVLVLYYSMLDVTSNTNSLGIISETNYTHKSHQCKLEILAQVILFFPSCHTFDVINDLPNLFSTWKRFTIRNILYYWNILSKFEYYHFLLS